MTEPVLSLRGITKRYGPLEVVKNVSLDVFPGEVVALLGENGAGKSTLSGIIAGSKTPSDGKMTWLGQPYAPASPREAIDKGVVLIHQELQLLPELSIAENVFLGRWPMKNGVVDRKQMVERAQEQLSRLNLHIPATRKVAGLSTANQQLIEIAKALALDARLLILDEPTAALGGAETEALFEQIRKLRAEGVGIIYISHRMEEIRKITDRIVVLRDGERVHEFPDSSVPVRTIVESMVGRSLERMFPARSVPQDKTVLEVKNLTGANGAFNDVSFSVKAGEILGIAGLVGAGRTELVRAIAGADAVRSGEVHMNGEKLSLKSPADAIDRGIVMVPEDRKLQGVVVAHKIDENLVYANLDRFGSRWITPAKKRSFAEKAIRTFGVKGRGEQLASDLSGGNQQKVVIAKWLMRDPKVVVLDEPTRGIDVGARAGIYDIIANLAKDGVAVIVVSSDLEEVLGVSHRILVLAQGKQAGILDREQANDVSVMELATL